MKQSGEISTENGTSTKLGKFQIFGVATAVLGFFLVQILPIPGLTPMAARMLAIFIVAISLWVTEAISLVATAVMVIMLEVFMISSWAILPLEGLTEPAKATSYFAALADPVIILFLGGFMIAQGAEKYGLDKALSAILLRPFLGSARKTLLGLMIITAFLSMWMSNTATTATMFAVLAPVLHGLPKGRSRTGFALAIPVAANVGGIGTPVGTPPNAIAIGALANQGIHVSFAAWMAMAVPLMLVILGIAWVFLAWRYVPKGVKFDIALDAKFDTSRPAIVFYCICGLTIFLWCTEALHGINSNAVGFIPVVFTIVTKVMDEADIKTLDWPTLWLVSGGIALGKGVGNTGLDAYLIGSIPWNALSSVLLLAVLALVGFAMSNVMSHSASANLLVPLGIGLAATLSSANNMEVYIASILALGCSLGMCLPISTPPNAIAYSTREVPTKHMAITGLVVGLSGVILLASLCPTYWALLGVS